MISEKMNPMPGLEQWYGPIDSALCSLRATLNCRRAMKTWVSISDLTNSWQMEGSMRQFNTIVFFILGIAFLSCRESAPVIGTIKGQVTDMRTGKTVEGAKVCTQPPTGSITSGSSGKYVICDMSPGIYVVIASHADQIGNRTVIVAAGKTTIADLPLESINHQPNSPIVDCPPDSAVDVPFSLRLAWSCVDPDGDPLVYNIYLDSIDPPLQVIGFEQSDTSFLVRGFDTATTYYWRILASDNHGGITMGNVWRFSTSGGLAARPLAYYPFNGDAEDASGNEKHCTVNGATLTADRFGNAHSAYSFDGRANYIAFPVLWDSPPLEATISVWFYASVASIGSPQAIVFTGDDGELLLQLKYLEGSPRRDPPEKLSAWQKSDRPEGQESNRTNGKLHMQAKLTDGRWRSVQVDIWSDDWYHAVGIWRRGSCIQLYLNGRLGITESISDLNLFDPGEQYLPSLGAHSRLYYRDHKPFNGVIDDVRIYDRALSETEINALYHDSSERG